MKYFLLLFSLFICLCGFAQDADKTVSITVSGSGKTQEEAKQVALRSAIEQAFGAFISSKTDVLNDKIISDQVASVASGNIKTYSVLNESQLPDSTWNYTLSVTVSLNKLQSFVEAKGFTVVVNGNMFASNIRQQMFNETAEENAVFNLFSILHEYYQRSFDYSIITNDPISLDETNTKWERKFLVSSSTNKNISFCNDFLLSTLSSISLSNDDLETYKKLLKKTYKISFLNINGDTLTYHFRTIKPIEILKSIFNNLYFYIKCFKVDNGSNSIESPGDMNISKDAFFYKQNSNETFFKLLDTNFLIAKMQWSEINTLDEIEKISEYKVSPLGVVSYIKYGGYLLFESNGTGVVSSIVDLGNFNWDDANKLTYSFKNYNFTGWQLPTIVELKLMDSLLFFNSLGQINKGKYWSKNLDDLNFNNVCTFNFENKEIIFENKGNNNFVRLIRRFSTSKNQTFSFDTANITGETIYNRYINSIGGDNILALINTKEIHYDATIDNFKFEANLYVNSNVGIKYEEKIPYLNDYIDRILIHNNVGYKTVKDEKILMSVDDLNDILMNYDLQFDLHQKQYGFTRNYIGSDEKNYLVDRKDKNNVHYIEYFDKVTGFKVCEEFQDKKKHTIIKNEYLNYKEVESLPGYFVPSLINKRVSDVIFVYKLKNILINNEIRESVFVW